MNATGRHLVLDLDVFVEACRASTMPADLRQLLGEAQAGGARAWVAATTLALATERLGAEAAALLPEAMQRVGVLTAFGFEQPALVSHAAGLVRAQVLAAARALPKGWACIVTRDAGFAAADDAIEVLAPAAARAWLTAAPGTTQPLPFVDLARQQALLRPALERGVEGVLRQGQYILGAEVQAFEQRLADFAGVRHCVSVANGTDALQVALMALGVGPGDEVVTPAFNFVAAAEAALVLGARPVFVDIDPRTYNLDPARLAEALTARTRAIVPSSLYGQCADIEAIVAVARGIPVIEDAAQSLGASRHGRASGSGSTLATTSFFPSKPLGGYGDGGAILTDDAALADAVARISLHGQAGRYRHVRVGVNSRLDTLQAAVLLAKLDPLPAELEARQAVAAGYAQRLQARAGLPAPPWVAPGHRSAWAQYTVRVPQRDGVREAMARVGVPTIVHYPLPLHRQPAMAQPALVLPQSERAAAEVLSLPFGPWMRADEQDRVVDALARALAAG